MGLFLLFGLYWQLNPVVLHGSHNACHVDDALGLVRCEVVVQAGPTEMDSFTIHRVVKLDAGRRVRHISRDLLGALVLVPGSGSNFSMYQAGTGDNNLVDYLALRGVDVYGYSPRTRGMAQDHCDVGDCSFMSDWGLQTYVDDVGIIRILATLISRRRPVVGGYSLGALVSIASANQKPHAFAGYLLIDGALDYGDAALRSTFIPVCDALNAQIDAGVYHDNTQYAFLQNVWSLSHTDPDAPSPFAPGLTNHQFFLLLATTPREPPAGYTPGFYLATGSIVTGFTYSGEAQVDHLFGDFNMIEPLPLIRDYTCAFAGDTRFTDNLASVSAPILAFEAGGGFGAYMDDNIALFGTEDVTVIFEPNYGHGDFVTHRDIGSALAEPIFAWLEAVVF